MTESPSVRRTPPLPTRVQVGLVAALIAAEKLLPRPGVVTRGVAVVAAALGIAVALTPRDVPGLTIPGSTGAMSPTKSMR